jgi:hypothetical protein
MSITPDKVAKFRQPRRLLRPSDPAWKIVEEAAAHLGTIPTTLNKMRVDGTGPRYTKRFGRIYYRVDWLDAWLEAGVRTSTSDGHPAAHMPKGSAP